VHRYVPGRGLDSLDGLSIVLGTKHAAARYDGIRTSLNDLPGIVRGHATINLNPGIAAALIAHGLQGANLVDLALNELLTAKPGVDRHDEDKVDVVENALNGRKRSTRAAKGEYIVVHKVSICRERLGEGEL